MKNICSYILIVLILFAVPASWAADDSREGQPDRYVRMCGPELASPSYEPEPDEATEGAGFFDLDDDFRARITPGVDEVQERDPDEADALDPGTF